MIKIVVKMNSLRFKTVYYLTCDKYYHIAIWTYLKLGELCKKCRKTEEEPEDEDKEHAKHFNLLKPLSRFYHFINLSGIVMIWLVVNCLIAFLVELKNSGESISMANFLIGVIIATLVGHVLIMVITKVLHVLYMKNIEDAFEDQQTEVTLKKKPVLRDETSKSESAPMLKNEYKHDLEKFETKNSQKWDETSRGSSKGFDTARQMVVETSKPGSASNANRVVPVDTESEHLPQISSRQTFLGDTEVMDAESKRSNNSLNTVIFMILLGFIAFLTLFCCIYTYHHYSQSVILACLLMVILSSLIEVLVLRPFTCLILTLFTLIKRKVKSKEIMMREIEEVKEELGLNRSQQSKDGISQDANMNEDSASRVGKVSQDLENSHKR